MRRLLLITFITLVVLSGLLFGTAAWMINDEEFLKAQIGKQVHKFTGRDLVVSGPLDIQLGRETTISAGNISFSNAEWADAENMVRVGELEVRIVIPSLFNGQRPAIPWIMIDDCSIDLQQNDSGENNWDVLPEAENNAEPKPAGERNLPVELDKLSITNCELHLDGPRRTRPLHVAVQEIALDRNADSRVTGTVGGSINDERITIDGWLEPANSFLHGGPVEHDLKIQFGQVSLQSAGTVADALTLAGADIKTRFYGPAIEDLLDNLSLPPLSEGDFDFRLNLDTVGNMTQLDIDGDLGSIDLLADGEVDHLLKPSAGNLVASLEGPDLEALGMALGIEGLLPTQYAMKTRAEFNGSKARFADTEIQAGGDRLKLSGIINAQTGLPDSALDVRFESVEVGRWAPLVRLTRMEIGELVLEGKVDIDDNGIVAIDAGTDFKQSHLQAKGTIGTLTGPYEPDFALNFNSLDASPLLALAGIEDFPAEPLRFEGHVQLVQNRMNISEFALDFAGNHAKAAGILSLAERFSGSELDVSLDIKDVQQLGQLFGKQGLPAQPLAVSGTLKPEGKGLAFDINQSSLGEISLKAKGRVADLEKPLGLDAEFDVSLPGLDLLSAVLPDLPWPPGVFKAAGSLHNEAQLTRLQDVRMELGDIRAAVTGNLLHDNRFDLEINMQGPDATVFAGLVGQPLEADPFSVKTGLSGSPTALSFEKLLIKLGESSVWGKLDIGLGKPVQITAALHSPYLDMRNWNTEAKAEDTATNEPPSRYVFDDTPILSIADYGVEADASIKVDVLDLGNTQLKDIDIGLLLQKDFLELKPLNVVGKGGGALSGTIRYDRRHAVPSIHYDLQARNLRAGLGSGVGQDTSTWPAGDFDLVIDGTGHTRRDVAASLNGKIRVHFTEGLVAMAGLEFLMSDFITELITALNPFAKTSEYTNLQCAVMAADIVDGQVKVVPIIFNTDQITILSQGKIDLTSEKIDLSFNTKAKKGLGVSAGALINPFIKVGGQLNSPTVELDPAGTVVKGGIAVATMGLSILAKSMSDRFLSSEDPCGDALKEIAERDGTPP